MFAWAGLKSPLPRYNEVEVVEEAAEGTAEVTPADSTVAM
jgi:hypothetical protein